MVERSLSMREALGSMPRFSTFLSVKDFYLIKALMRMRVSNSGVAQWLACWAHNSKVGGSKPLSASFFCGAS